MKNHNVEVLAPAGSYDIMKAVINAGADAVYLGGDMFGARAYAGNLNKEEMIRALDYAHLRDKKIYLTVNTLLKENECTHELVDYIAPFYEAGLDACIVQDMGVFKILHSAFPDMHMHASTQMTITGEKGASILKEMGAMRIVTARELTLDEIRQIHEKCDIEIESFVHGALCYCYSGQCLLSSMNGTRSGNRGRCAQACRLDYSVVNNDKVINDSKSSYPLSPKDMCALDILPDIIDAGVYSMKIEGRMKNVTYAAGVTSIYRKYTDMYLENGRKGYRVSQEDKNMLLDIFNRGSFTSGYYNSEKGKNMMSLSRPNHMGVKALQVVKNDNGRILFKALTDINPQDVFEIDSDNAYTSGDSYKKGSTFTVNLSRKLPLYKDRIIYRMKNGSVTKEIAEKYASQAGTLKKPVNMLFTAECGKPMKLELEACNTKVSVFGASAEIAGKQPATVESCIKNLSKLGNTDFTAGKITADIGTNVFVPVSILNDLRRKGIEKLTETILDKYRRQTVDESVYNVCKASSKDISGTVNDSIHDGKYRTSVYLKTKGQLKSYILSGLNNDNVYADFRLFDDDECRKNIKKLADSQNVTAALPYIITQSQNRIFGSLIENIRSCNIEMFLVRNLEEIGCLGNLGQKTGFVPKIVTDAGLYCWNSFSVLQLRDIISVCGCELTRITLPYELNYKEMNMVNYGVPTEFVAEGFVPVMISKQCVRKTYGLCDHNNGIIYLNNKRSGTYMVESVCSFCHSVMYSAKRIDVGYDSSLLEEINPDYIRKDYDNMHDETAWTGHYAVGVE